MKYQTEILSAFIFLLTVSAIPAAAQQTENLSIKGVVADATDSLPVAGAVVSLIIPQSDTVYCITDTDGKYHFQSEKQPSSVEAAMLGYGIGRISTDKTGPVQDYGILWLFRESYAIDEAVVNARVKKIVFRGDTVQFNAAAFKVLRGGTAGDLVAKMPGMEVDNGSVKFRGEQVNQAYVDGTKLYGSGTANLLENLEASDVISVDVYQEVSEGDELIGNTAHGKRNWALNFHTFSKLTEHMIGHALASYGADEDRNFTGERQQRYGAGLTLNYFSEKWSLMGNVFANNIDRSTNKINEITDATRLSPGINNQTAADISTTINIGKVQISPSYVYEDRTSRLLNYEDKLYFAGEDGLARQYVDSTFSNSFNSIHTIGLDVSSRLKKSYIYFNSSTSFSRNSSSVLSNGYSTAGENLLSDYSSSRNDRGNGFMGYYRLDWQYRIGRKGSLYLSADASLSSGHGMEIQADSTFTGSGYTNLNLTKSDGRNNVSITVSPSYTYNFSPRFQLAVSLRTRFNDNNTEKIAVDDITGLIDPSQTYDYIDKSTVLSPGINLSILKRNHRINFGINNEITLQKFNIPSDWTDRTYYSPQPYLNYILQNPFYFIQSNTFTFAYRARSVTPAMNMLSPVVNTMSANYFMAGNPDLKQSYEHSAHLGFNWMQGETSGKFIASGYYIHNNIVANRTLFFDTETVLDGYGGFTAPAGSMLNTYENIDDTFRARAELGVDFPINPIGCMFKTGLRYNFNYNPYFQGTEELIAREHGAALNLGIDSNFSEYFEFGINSRTGFSYTRRSNGTMERLWAESLQARADAIMLKEIVRIGAFYDMSIYRYPEFESGNRTTHMLNMTLNFSFLKERNLSIGVAVYDILNNRNAFLSKITTQYRSNSWSGMTGRYYLINLSYRFNYKKSEGRKINDGGFKSRILSAGDTAE